MSDAISKYQELMGKNNISNDFSSLYKEITDLQSKLTDTSTPYDSTDASNKIIEKKYRNPKLKTNGGKYYNPNVQTNKCGSELDETGSKIINKKNCGLFYNTKELVKEINTEGFREYNAPLVEVTIKKANGENETKKMSYDDYNNLSITAFPDDCKRFSAMPEGLCLSNEKLSEKPRNPLDPNINIDEEALTQKIMADSGVSEDMLNPSIDGFQSFYHRYKQTFNPLNNYDVVDETKTEIYDSIEKKVLVIEKDLSTTLFIAGFSIVGLTVLARLLQK